MKDIKNKQAAFKRASIYLILTTGVCLLVGGIAIVAPKKAGAELFLVLQKIFTAIPVLAVVVTRFITKDTSSWNLNLKVWKQGRMLLFSALVPGLAVLIGAGIYYVFYPEELVENAQALLDFCVQYGLPDIYTVNAGTIVIIALVLWLLSIVAVPIHLLELGEELGWRGYLLPLFTELMSVRKAVLFSNVFWGITHAPLIYFGFNYGDHYFGAPYSGIFMMSLFCVSIGIWMSFVQLKTNNCMYAAIIHGAVNVAADMQILSLAMNRPLLGPAPTGILGMSVILGLAIYLFSFKLKNDLSQTNH